MPSLPDRQKTSQLMWQALISEKHPVPKSTVYASKRGFRASSVDGYRVLSRRVSNGNYLTFCSTEISHQLAESQDVGKFVCGYHVQQKIGPISSGTCSICFDAVELPSGVFIADCGHVFHRTCVHKAWKFKLRSCALCRHPIKTHFLKWNEPEDVDEDDWITLKMNGWHRYEITARSTRATRRPDFQ